MYALGTFHCCMYGTACWWSGEAEKCWRQINQILLSCTFLALSSWFKSIYKYYYLVCDFNFLQKYKVSCVIRYSVFLLVTPYATLSSGRPIYIGRMYRYHPKTLFIYLVKQYIYWIFGTCYTVSDFAPTNAVYSIPLSFLFRKIFMFYVKAALKLNVQLRHQRS